VSKITHAASKLHDEAMALLNLERKLTEDEIEKVFRQYNPAAEHNVGKAAIFFTPWDVAYEFACAAENDSKVIDLCAGIGILSKHMLIRSRRLERLVCVEISQVFVDIGKKLVPEAEWYCRDVFDLDFLQNIGTFDLAISNPPYGNVSNKSSWTVKAPAQWQVMEVALRLAGGGMFIVPELDTDYSTKLNEHRERPNCKKFLGKRFPEVTLNPSSWDIDGFRDQWVEAAPFVAIASLAQNTTTDPYGFEDLKPEPTTERMLDVPVVKKQPKEKATPKEKPASPYKQTSMF